MRTKTPVVVLCLVVLAVLIVASPSVDYLTGFVTKTGQLLIGNSAPEVNYVYLNSQMTTDNPADVTINPVENSTRAVYLKVTITDLNGNCDAFTGDNGTAYLCNGTGPCNANTADHTITLNYNATDGQWGSGNRYCNMSGPAEDLQFFDINGTWRVNVTITDGINDSSPLVKNWSYGELAAFSYAPTGTVFMGTLNLAQWNNGTGQEETKNTGNIILDLDWNATNFTGQLYGQGINKTGDNYIIDDDASSPDDTGNLAEVLINESDDVQVSFVPASGLLRCSSVACGNDNATFDVYWHIYIPGGLKEDTYQNSIEVESSYH